MELVSVALKVGSAGVVHVVSCYAPTFAASREEEVTEGCRKCSPPYHLRSVMCYLGT